MKSKLYRVTYKIGDELYLRFYESTDSQSHDRIWMIAQWLKSSHNVILSYVPTAPNSGEFTYCEADASDIDMYFDAKIAQLEVQKHNYLMNL